MVMSVRNKSSSKGGLLSRWGGVGCISFSDTVFHQNQFRKFPAI
jgi:hypothetical protein